jgi:3-methylcrotonyl-CoA carboxylase alpha subunit
VSVAYRAKGWRLSIDGRAVESEAAFAEDGSLSAKIAGRSVTARVLRVNGTLAVLMRGQSFVFTPHDPLETAEHAQTDGSDIRAPMPGKIIQLMTKAGDRVRRGQPLAILEAMKMEHTLNAPGDLTVKAVPFKVGDQVTEGAVIVGFETESK